MCKQDTKWSRDSFIHRGSQRLVAGFAVTVTPTRGGRWEYKVHSGSTLVSTGQASTESEVKRAATLAAKHATKSFMALKVGGWHAKWSASRPRSIYVDYEGQRFKRSQSLVRYDNGSVGWDFPEQVPNGVRKRIERWSFEVLPAPYGDNASAYFDAPRDPAALE